MNDRELKEHIRLLRKIKKDCPTKTQSRRNLNAEIRGLKKQLEILYAMTPEKEKLIQTILKLEPDLRIDLRKFSVEELKNHLKRRKIP